jgi:hypothetical protein
VNIYVLEDNENNIKPISELESLEYGGHKIIAVFNIANAINDIAFSGEFAPEKTDAYIFDLQINDSNGLPEEYVEDIRKGKKYSGYALMECLRDDLGIDISEKVIFCTGYYQNLKEQIGEEALNKLRVVNKSSINALSEILSYLNIIADTNRGKM